MFPTAMVWPSGLQVMLMFSPLVVTVVTAFWLLASHTRTVLSPLAVASMSGLVGCQHSWSTLSPWPLNTCSLDSRSLPRVKMQTVLS